MARADDQAEPEGSVDLDAAVAALYRGPLGSFVAERDALARTLRSGGRGEDATAVKALRKPKLVAWALDAAGHAAPAPVDELVEAADAVTDAQTRGGDVRAALARLREAEGALAAAAAGAAREHDQAIDPATLALGLRAVIGDPGALADLRAGRLVDIPSAGDLGSGLAVGFGPDPGPSAGGATKQAAPRSGRSRPTTAAGSRTGSRAASRSRGGRSTAPAGSPATSATDARSGVAPSRKGPSQDGDGAGAAPTAADRRRARLARAAAAKQVSATAAAARKAASDADAADRAARRAEDQAGAARRRADEARGAAERARGVADDRAERHREAEAALAAADADLDALGT